MADEIQVQSEPNGMYAVAGYIDDATGETRKVTDAVPLPVTAAGGASEATMADAAASLAVIDDWDESDRAKVNPIVGQAGVAAGAGAVGATVQRVTLASDDPLVTQSATPSSGGNGAKTVTTAGTAETLAPPTACRAVKISNPSTNSGPAAWGFDANVTAAGASLDGCQIAVGGTSGWIAIDDLAKIYVDVAADGENLGYVYLL